MAISAVTLAELVHGAEESQFPERDLTVVEDFFSRLTVLPYPEEAAYHYGSIRAELERQGMPIGVNDLHIAAHARSCGLTVLINNLGEFSRVPGLLLENRIAPYSSGYQDRPRHAPRRPRRRFPDRCPNGAFHR